MRLTFATAALGALTVAVFSSTAIGQTYAELVADLDRQLAEWQTAYEAGTADPRAYPPISFVPTMKALAERTAGTPAALDPLMWLLTNALSLDQAKVGNSAPVYEWAVAQLKQHHLASERLLPQLAIVPYAALVADRKLLIELFEAILAKNQKPEIQAAARYGLAFVQAYEPEKRSAAERAAAIANLRVVAKDFPDTPQAKEAELLRYDLEHLQIGMIAPEVTGSDPDGNPLKLTTYRGNVLILDFWGYL